MLPWMVRLCLCALSLLHSAQGGSVMTEQNLAKTVDNALPPLMFAAAYGNAPLVKALLSRPDQNVDVRDWIGQTPLHLAAKFGKMETVRLLVAHGADVNARNRDFDEAPLHLAAKSGYVELVAFFIDHGADVDAMTLPKNLPYLFGGGTPITYAIENRDANALEVVKVLVEKGQANVNKENLLKQTPLHLAVRLQNLELARYLLDKGANLEARDGWQKSPLNLLVSDLTVQPQLPMIAFLLNRGASLSSFDAYKRSPIQNAVIQGYQTVVRYLLHLGADINEHAPFARTILRRIIIGANVHKVETIRFLMEIGADVNIGTADGCNRPLYDLASLPDEDYKVNAGIIAEIALTLVNNGALTTYREPCSHQSPMDLAITRNLSCLLDVFRRSSVQRPRSSPKSGHESLGRQNNFSISFSYVAKEKLEDFVYELSKTTDGGIYQRDWQQQTALHLCSYFGFTHKSMVLGYIGYDIDAKDANSRTPLHNAARMGNVMLMEFFLNRGANIESTDGAGLTSLLAATWFSGSEEAVHFLIKKGANILATDSMGLSALHFAAAKQNLEIMQVLVDAGMPIDNHQRPTDLTPLSYLLQSKCCYPQMPTVDLLVKHGARVNARDVNGRTPLQGAISSGKGFQVILYLLFQGADPSIADANGCNPPLLTYLKRSLESTTIDDNTIIITIRWLMYYGADPYVKDPCINETAISFMSRVEGHDLVARAL